MKREIKESLQIILEGREYAYNLFHKLLGTAMTQELMDAFTSASSIEALLILKGNDGDCIDSLATFAKRYALSSKEQLSQIHDEYTRLFIGPERLIAPPWESVYTSIERTLFQPSTLEVRSWYKRYGYLPADYPHVADDHIALMLHFMALLTHKVSVCVEENAWDEARSILADQKKFLTQHIINWADNYREAMEQSASHYFYPQLIALLEAFEKYDSDVIDELLAAI